MEITAEDIRFARPCDLEALTGIHGSSFTSWTKGKRSITTRSLNLIAEALEMQPEEFLQGWNLRRQEAVREQETLAKFQMLIAQRNAA
jgi:transcriptional regulator with XRE-family HTH domain